MARIFLTHPPEALANYYGPRAVAGLEALDEVRFMGNVVLSSSKRFRETVVCLTCLIPHATILDLTLIVHSPHWTRRDSPTARGT